MVTKAKTDGDNHGTVSGAGKVKESAAKKAGDTARSKAAASGDAGEGKVIQHKPTIGEALAGEAKGLAAIGEGSAVEAAPRIMGAVVQATQNDREVRQGDEVILHTRSLLNGKLENVGKMLKANQDQTIAVRIPLQTGGYRDFSPVYNGPQNGEDWFSVPDKPTGALDQAEAAEEAELEAQDAVTAQLAADVKEAESADQGAKVDDGAKAE